jgi:hypothetical protein
MGVLRRYIADALLHGANALCAGSCRSQDKLVMGVVIALNSATRQLLDEMMPGLVAKVENDYREASGKTTK